jgi:IS5 family transposase
MLAADKGYDSAEFRELLRLEEVRPVINRHKLRRLVERLNARLDDESHRQRFLRVSLRGDQAAIR